MAKPRLDPKAPRRKWKLRQWFLKNGGRREDIPRGFKWQTPRVGAPARTLIKRVQRMAKLKHVSGQFDLATRQLLFPPRLGPEIVRVMLAEVGVREHPAGSNDGPRIRDYQRTTGAFKAPWCASFHRWGIVEAATRLKRSVPKGAPNPAYVPSITDTIRRGLNGWRSIPYASAAPGDTVCLWGSQHVETVVKRRGDVLHCVGGNTSAYGQSNHGGMVARTVRHRSEVTIIGRAW